MGLYDFPTTIIFISPDESRDNSSRNFDRLAKSLKKDIISLPVFTKQKSLKELATILALTDTKAAFISPKFSSQMLRLSDKLSRHAKASGAVDFVVLNKKKLHGHFLLGESFSSFIRGLDSISISESLPWGPALKKVANLSGVKHSKDGDKKVVAAGKATSSKISIADLERESWKKAIALV